jgi:hypothetical protein
VGNLDKKVFINILIGKEKEDLLGKMSKEERKKLEKLYKRCKPVLDALGKKETTDKDIRDFINLIEGNLISKFLVGLRWAHSKLLDINKEVALWRLIKNWEKEEGKRKIDK